GVPPDPTNPVAPYTAAQLAPLAGMTARAVLAFFHQHRGRCVEAGRWVEPAGAPDAPPPAPASDLGQLWNDRLAEEKPPPGDEPNLAGLLAWAVRAASAEVDGGVFFGAEADDRFVQVETHAGNAVDKLLAAVCDRNAKGGGLGKQVEEVTRRAGEIPAVFLRSTDFPHPTAGVTKQLAKLCAPVGRHRKHVVADSDWRLMTAFRAFAAANGKTAGFADWQRSAKPLTGLPSIRAVLALDTRRTEPPPPPPPAEDDTFAPPPPAAPAAIRLGQTRGAAPAAVELDRQSLCRHAAFLGGTNSGKTTAALTIVEQLLMGGVPVVLVDRKGDLARYADPDAWTAPEPDADRADRRARLRAAIDVALYTPGKDAGRPLSIPVAPPDLGRLPDADREQFAQYAAAALGVMMGYKSRGPDPKLVILQKAIETLAAASDQPVTVKALQRLVGDQDDALTAHFDGQYEGKHFAKLSQDLLSLGLQHRRLLEGADRLDVDTLLGRGPAARAGRTRLSVVSTQFLGDDQATDFWVSLLLLAVERWTRQHPAADGRLQAVFLFDEADKYLPAVGKPATKGPMESLLKRARSAGVGVFLATQSPGDLDYKCRDQVTTWLVGRVKEAVAVAKLRPVLEARPGAADRLAEQKAGEFYLAREGEVRPVRADLCLIPPLQLPEDRILAVARPAGRS
ncbi:MAG TPA: helicase HerA-like domain-containing protein, partial [Urbifossiella sp.]|nr:helicase HerA-like domain-containing protein [Urbifossiella sp.]